MSASAPDDPLMRLAALAGIATAYRDVWGRAQRVAPESPHAVLAALGIAAGTPGEVAESVEALEAEAWRSLLPPAVVLRGGTAAAALPLTVPAELAAGRVHWHVMREDGGVEEGSTACAALTLLAERPGGEHRRVALPLSPDLPLGYHRLNVTLGAQSAETVLIVAPERCALPPALAEGHAWGLTAQLYAVRSARNWGMGDFTDLAALGALTAARGASVLGLNPLHALFPATPGHISPYSPSSRLFLNPLYIDITAVPDFADSPEAQMRLAGADFQAALGRARERELVDYGAVAALKAPLFAELHRRFATRHLGDDPEGALTERGAQFRRFQREGGAVLAGYGTFNVLQAQMLARSGAFCWRDWPEPLRDSGSAEVQAFAAAHWAEIERHHYLEWEANRQLAAAASSARDAGLGLGFYRDLAVGVDPNGASCWGSPDLHATGASVGAPPDLLNRKGQDWGLAPINPMILRRKAYEPFIAALRANMRHAGALRIDHAMALKQLYWVPRGAGPQYGAYVAYPFEDLIGILALESMRNSCAVIGEDLGTVPEGFSDGLNATGVLSYRVMLFEQDERGFLPPDAYRQLAAASFSTHDIATLKGFWLGRDLEWRRKIGLYPNEAAAEQDRDGRRRDRRSLLAALVAEQVLAEDAARRFLPDDDTPVYGVELAEAVHRFLGHTASCLALLQVEDAIGEEEQANLPGTIDQHPNWRRRLACTLDDLARDPGFLRVSAALDEGRKEQPSPS